MMKMMKTMMMMMMMIDDNDDYDSKEKKNYCYHWHGRSILHNSNFRCRVQVACI